MLLIYIQSLAILTPPSSSAEAAGGLHFFLRGRVEVEVEVEEKGTRKAKRLREFVWKKSEQVLEKKVVFASEVAITMPSLRLVSLLCIEWER